MYLFLVENNLQKERYNRKFLPEIIYLTFLVENNPTKYFKE